MKGFKANSDLPLPNYKDVFRLLKEEEIFAYYIPNLVINGRFQSPLGEKDKHPSFSVFWSYRKHKYIFKDFRYGYTGDAVDLVRYLFNFIDNTTACMKIFRDFNISGFKIHSSIKASDGNHSKIIKSIPRSKKKISLKVTVREWKDYDLKFWSKFGINLEALQFGDIYPISHYFINGSIRIADKYAYAYVERKDGKLTFKIYQPFNKVGMKWRSSNDNSVWELWNQLPSSHDILVITKSRKDALSIIFNLRIPATALQAEGTIPKEKVINELKKRFKMIYLFYDNDFDSIENWGQNYANKLSEKFDIPNIFIPDNFQAKDFSDFILKYSIKEAKEMLWKLMKN